VGRPPSASAPLAGMPADSAGARTPVPVSGNARETRLPKRERLEDSCPPAPSSQSAGRKRNGPLPPHPIPREPIVGRGTNPGNVGLPSPCKHLAPAHAVEQNRQSAVREATSLRAVDCGVVHGGSFCKVSMSRKYGKQLGLIPNPPSNSIACALKRSLLSGDLEHCHRRKTLPNVDLLHGTRALAAGLSSHFRFLPLDCIPSLCALPFHQESNRICR
jgi:hypothetical protein